MAKSRNRSLSYESLSLNGYPADQVKAITYGRPGTLSFRVMFSRNGSECVLMSPWHDILLFAPNGFLTCVCSTPAGSWLVHEPAMDEPFTPLRSAKTWGAEKARGFPAGQPRPSHLTDNSLWNVGILPQTWITTSQKPGSFLPLEVIDIGAGKERQPGDVYVVKPLGACCLEEDGAIVWKIIGIASEDSMAGVLNDIDDIETWLPGLLELVQDWLKNLACEKSGLPVEDQLCTLVDLYLTRQKLFELHDSWRLHPARVAMHAANSLVNLQSLHPVDYHNVWTPYLDRYREASGEDSMEEEISVPTSCPEGLSEILFDADWLTESGKGLSSFHRRIVEETEEAMVEVYEEPSGLGTSDSLVEALVEECPVEFLEDPTPVEHLEDPKTVPKGKKTKFGSLVKAKNGLMKLLNLRRAEQGSRDIRAVMETVEKKAEAPPRMRSEELRSQPKIRGLFSQSSLDSFGVKQETAGGGKTSDPNGTEKKRLHSGEILGGFGLVKPILRTAGSMNQTQSCVQLRKEEPDFSRQLGKGSSSSDASENGSSGDSASVPLGKKGADAEEMRTRHKLAVRYKLSASGKVLLSSADRTVLVHSSPVRFEERKLRRSMTCREPVNKDSVMKALVSFD